MLGWYDIATSNQRWNNVVFVNVEQWRINIVYFNVDIKGAEATYNHFHSTLRLFDVLTNFPFTTSETIRDY